MCLKVPPSQILEFVSAIDKVIHEERKTSEDSISQDRIELIKHLKSIKKQAEEIKISSSEKHGPPPPADFSPDRGNSPATTPHSVPCGAVPAIGGPAALVKFGQSKLSSSVGGSKVSFYRFGRDNFCVFSFPSIQKLKFFL